MKGGRECLTGEKKNTPPKHHIPTINNALQVGSQKRESKITILPNKPSQLAALGKDSRLLNASNNHVHVRLPVTDLLDNETCNVSIFITSAHLLAPTVVRGNRTHLHQESRVTQSSDHYITSACTLEPVLDLSVLRCKDNWTSKVTQRKSNQHTLGALGVSVQDD